MWREFKPAIIITLLLTALCGVVYPLAITGAARLLFPKQAAGSLIERGGKVVGSELIGQNFSKPEYFHPRPSAAGNGYDAANSSGSNLGPTNPALADRLAKDAAQFRKDNPDYSGPIPADAITASGSGLDPDISPANALAQAPRIAIARGITVKAVNDLIARDRKGRDLGFIGEPRVNVLRLNMDLDASSAKR
jgi:K+-transporting ATPase ATPase C chain